MALNVDMNRIERFYLFDHLVTNDIMIKLMESPLMGQVNLRIYLPFSLDLRRCRCMSAVLAHGFTSS